MRETGSLLHDSWARQAAMAVARSGEVLDFQHPCRLARFVHLVRQ
jgi:hypothetical protein